MAFVHGRHAAIYLDETDLTSYFNQMDFGADVDTAETSVFGNTWKTHDVGQAGATVTFGGFYDPDQDHPIEDIGSEGSVLTWCPGGSALGDRARLGAVISTSYGESQSIGDEVAIAWDVQLGTAVAFGDIIHPLSEDTNTTTGSSIDQSASSATGWTAHLHVTAVDDGSWVVKVQDSSTGSSGWADIVTFTAATGPTAERLVSAAADTAVKRYIRVVATRTGGTTGDGITYLLAFARANQ